MLPIQPTARPLLSIAIVLSFALPVSAKGDRIYFKHKDNSKAVSASVTSVSRETVDYKVNGKAESVPSQSIRQIIWNGEPSHLTSGRAAVFNRQFDRALTTLKKTKYKGGRAAIAEDIHFYIALAKVESALRGKESVSAAGNGIGQFLKNNKDSRHYYAACESLMRLGIGINKSKGTLKYASNLLKSKDPNVQLTGHYIIGLARLRSQEYESALKRFDKVIKTAAKGHPGQNRLAELSKAGRVAALGQLGKTDQAIEESMALIEKLVDSDSELASRIYNARGATYWKANKLNEASVAYLHTTLLFTTNPNAHAEALSALASIWSSLDKTKYANESQKLLEKQYPNWGE